MFDTLSDAPDEAIQVLANLPRAPYSNPQSQYTRWSTRLLGIGTAVPPHVADQKRACHFMGEVLSATAEATPAQLALLRRLYSNSGIDTRYSVLSDYTKADPAEFTFFPRNWAPEPFPTTAERMAAYELHAVDLAEEAARAALVTAGIDAESVTHLVISTCTGFFAPGADVLLLRRLGIPTTATRTVLGFMGCYAGVSGIRACHQAVQADSNAVVLQIAIELCSLHYQKSAAPDIMVANALFADGAAAAVYTSSSYTNRDASSDEAGTGAVVSGCWSDISPDSTGHMSWRIGDHGFLMQLDAGIPAVLKEAAPAFTAALAQSAGISTEDIAGWAVHPGGRKIVEAIQHALSLSAEDVSSSMDVLRSYGNMSSATVLFVLQRELARLRDNGVPLGSPIAAMAFGPGLTMEGALLRTA